MIKEQNYQCSVLILWFKIVIVKCKIYFILNIRKLKEDRRWIFYLTTIILIQLHPAAAVVQIAQVLVLVLAEAAKGVLDQNKKGVVKAMDFLFGTENDFQVSRACACAGGCTGCMGGCSGCSACQGSK